MAKTNETQNDAINATLWRVNYSYTVNGNLRSGSYVLPAETPQKARDEAQKNLETRFLNTGSYFKVTTVKAF